MGDFIFIFIIFMLTLFFPELSITFLSFYTVFMFDEWIVVHFFEYFRLIDALFSFPLFTKD